MKSPEAAPETAFREFAERFRPRLEAALERFLPPAATHPARLHEAMRYAVLDSGKRIRPLLVYGAGRIVGASPECLDFPACAVELVHAYSLVHDDLPAMDDDDLRRGKPTCHKAYGEAIAILTGDALQALAFQILGRMVATGSADQRLRMVELLARAAGSRGMAGGQSIDLDAIGKDLDIAQLEDMHIHKTGALIRASVGLGALCATVADADKVERLDRFAKLIGLAFQIRDDILNVTGDEAQLGKATGSDNARNKPTYPALLGLDGARRRAEELYASALENLAVFGSEADPLRGLCSYIIERCS